MIGVPISLCERCVFIATLAFLLLVTQTTCMKNETGVTIAEIYGFSHLKTGWNYQVAAKLDLPADCIFETFINEHGALAIMEPKCLRAKVLLNGTHSLTVIAKNNILGVTISYTITTSANVGTTIQMADVALHSNSDSNCMNSTSNTPALTTYLSMLLPKQLQSNIPKDDLLLPLYKLYSTHRSSDIRQFDKDTLQVTDGIVIKCDTGGKNLIREKRQLFSNLHSPVFSESEYTVSIKEEVDIGTQVIQITATDADESSAGTVRYALNADIDQRSLNIFQIDTVSGWVTTRARVNREDISMHKFTIKAHDMGSPSNSAQASLTINVEDINDHSPTFEKSSYNISVSEITSVGTTITRVKANDDDIGVNKVIKYSFVDAPSDLDFEINQDTGDIRVIRALDRERKLMYTVTVRAEDQATKLVDRLRSEVEVAIYITDYNDNSPIFSKSDYSFRVREDVNISNGPVVIGMVSATDRDSGDNGIVKYSITYGNPQPNVFDVVEDTGELRVITSLDREKPNGAEYNLRIKARDGGVSIQSSLVSVKVIVEDANDNAPAFRFSSYEYSVYEGGDVGSVIATLTASDPDEGENSRLSYSILPSLAGIRPLPVAIHNISGVLTNNATLDREAHARYEFQVEVEDHGNPKQATTTNVTLTILDRNDNEPEFTKAKYTAVISEDSQVFQEVVIVTANDPDENDPLSYQISSGDINNDFSISKEQTFGVIRVNKVLSYDRQKFYSMVVTASDTAGKSAQCAVEITITDKNVHPPVFKKETYEFSVSEDAEKGVVVGRVEAEDNDIELNGEIVYFIIGNGNPLPFTINNFTGEILVNDTLDRDNPSTQEFSIDVIARDRGIPPKQTDFPATVHITILDVNDNAPVFSKQVYEASISEDKAVDYNVTVVSAFDADQPGTPNSQIMYTFIGGDDGDGSFYIEPSGTIRIAKKLDRETVDHYNLIVFAKDRSNSVRLSSSATVKVTVLDVNDNAPKFESDVITRRIYENKPERTPVEPAITATDADIGDNAKISFELFGGDTFAFDLRDNRDSSFTLYSKVPLDYESQRKNYTLEVRALSQHLITTAKVIVKLQDSNDNRPELGNFTLVINNYRGYFPEGPIGRVPAFDPDETDRPNLRYSVKSGNEANFFFLNQSTGMITLNRALDSDRPTSGDFVIQVTDILNNVNATCHLVYRLITDEMLANSVTLRIDGLTARSFMSSIYNYVVSALAVVLETLPDHIYIIDIKEDTEVVSSRSVLNVIFAALKLATNEDDYLSQDYIQEQIYRNFDRLKDLSAVNFLPFDDSLCVLEPCSNYKKCSTTLMFDEAAEFIHSDAMLFRPIRTKAHYQCSCLSGFGGLTNALMCDTEINLCYSNPCLNSGICQQIENDFRCICLPGYIGDRCQYDYLKGTFNESFCPNEVCSGDDAYCVGLIKGGMTCQQDSARCQDTELQTSLCHQKTATFNPMSYITFPPLKSRFRFNLKVSFATRKKSGVLLYNGRYNTEHDFIALELVNHRLRFSMSLGNETYSLSLGLQYGLNDGQWHTVTVDYKNWVVLLSTDECDVALNLAHPEIVDYPCAAKLNLDLAERCLSASISDTKCSLDLTGPLLMGGLPSHLSISSLSSEHFVGCMGELYIDYKLVDLKLATNSHNIQDGCLHKRDFCITAPCKNQGTCTPSWSDYKCTCTEGKGDKDCSINTGSTYTLTGTNSYLQYSPGTEAIRKPWYNGFTFKTSVDDKLIMKIELVNGKTVQYKLKSGYITFSYANFSYTFDEAYVNDDKWHQFEMRLLSDSIGQGQILMSLDYSEIQKREALDNSLDNQMIKQIWVGESSTQANEMGFSGCVKDIRVGNIDKSYLSTVSKKSNVIDGCHKPERCSVVCPSGSSKCQPGWEESECSCNEGLVGPGCSSICSSAYNPCMNGGTCQIAREAAHGYRCVCEDKYQGEYCQEKIQDQCPASWWGSPVCGPCACDTNLNYDSQCDKVTGECVCKAGYYKPAGSAACVPCDCYYNSNKGGALSTSCDQQTGQCQCRDGVKGLRCDSCSNSFAEVTSQGCEVQYDSCPKDFSSGVWWSRTKFNLKRIELCPHGSFGNASRICKDNIDGWQEADLTQCTSLDFLKLNKSLTELEVRKDNNISEPIHGANSPSYTFIATDLITSLSKAVDSVQVTYANDLLLTVKILKEILLREKEGKSFDLTNTRDRYFLQNIVNITSHILNPRLNPQWKIVLARYSSSALADLVLDYDDYISNLADNMATKFVTAGLDPFQIVTPNMVLGADTIRHNNATIPKYNNIQMNPDMFDKSTSVKLPPKLFEESMLSGLKDKAVTGYILYRTLGDLIVSVSERTPFSDNLKKPKRGSLIINSAVFSLVLQQGPSKPNLIEPLEVTFLYTNSQFTYNPQCVYLTAERLWSTDGCSVKENLNDRVVCSCHHLSTFAVVTDFDPSMIGMTMKVYTHMYVTVSLAIFCLLFTLLIMLCLKDLKSNYIYIQINVLLCSCLSLIVYITGIDQWHNQPICTVVSVMLQFFVLALFAWTFVNALHLYRALTEKRNVDRDSMLLYILLGYVGPGIVTGLSVGLSPDAFGTDLFCWLSLDDTMIWSLGAPAIFCTIAVLVLLVLSIVHTCQGETIATSHKRQVKIFKTAVWISLGLLPFIVCLWTFALVTANTPPSEEKPYHIVFSLFVSLTALFTILAHVICNKRGRNEIQRRWKQCFTDKRFDGDSELSDKHTPFGEYINNSSLGGGLTQMTLAGGSESSTTSCSRLTTSAPSDLLGYLKNAPSSTSSDITGSSQARRAARRRAAADSDSDSDTDSDLRTEREKEIELASSHSSDEDEPIPPARRSGKAGDGNVSPDDITPAIHLTDQAKPLSPLKVDSPQEAGVPVADEELRYAPPPPYLITPGPHWPGRRLSDSTMSSHGTPSKAESASIRSGEKPSAVRPNNLSSSSSIGRKEPPKVPPRTTTPMSPFHNQYTNKSFVNSPSMTDNLKSVADKHVTDSPSKKLNTELNTLYNSSHLNSPTSQMSSLERKSNHNSLESDKQRFSPYHKHGMSPSIPNQRASPLVTNQNRASPLTTNLNRASPVVTNQSRASPLTSNQQQAPSLPFNQYGSSSKGPRAQLNFSPTNQLNISPAASSRSANQRSEKSPSLGDNESISTVGLSSVNDDVFMPQPEPTRVTLATEADLDILQDLDDETEV